VLSSYDSVRPIKVFFWKGERKGIMMATAVKASMTPYRKLLLKKRDELLAVVKNDALATNVQSPDEVEFAVKALEQDVTAMTVELHTGMLKEVERALKRVAKGTYGECEACGEEISPNRLKALPWARYCVTCQELRSRN
jgi:DnaK suppressor protein